MARRRHHSRQRLVAITISTSLTTFKIPCVLYTQPPQVRGCDGRRVAQRNECGERGALLTTALLAIVAMDVTRRFATGGYARIYVRMRTRTRSITIAAVYLCHAEGVIK